MDLCSRACVDAMSDNSTSGNSSDLAECLATISGNDTANTKEELSHNIVVAIFTSLLAFVILMGNGLIIVSVCVVRKLRQPANYLIVSLALSDFLVALVVLPLTIVYDILGEWVLGSTICNIHVSFDVICCATSILNLVMISIDRYLMVTRPLTYPKMRTAKLMSVMICSAWILACLVIFPALFGFTHNVTDDPSWIVLNNGSSEFSLSTESSSSGPIVENDTYWTSCPSSPLTWQHMVDLEEEYEVTQVMFESSNKDTELDFELQMIRQNASEMKTFKFRMFQSHEESITPTVARYIRILLNDSQVDYLNDTSFKIFGELTQGKGCLISQEKWFTVYSTVSSFYIPLAVMLFMYYKIYLEASRFKARHRAKSLIDQPHSLLSQSLSRRKKMMVAADESSSDLLDYYHEMKRLDTTMNTFDAHRRNTIETNISPARGTAETNFSEHDGKSTPNDSSSRDDAVFDSLPPSCEVTPKVSRAGEPLLNNGNSRNHSCSQNSTTKNLLEVNGNVPDGCQNATKTDPAWCKAQHYSSRDGVTLTVKCDSNGKDTLCKTSPRSKPKNNLKLTFSRRPSLLSGRRKSSRTPSSISTKSKRGSISIKRRFSASSSRERRRNAKAIRTLGIIVAAFTFCWLPFFTLTFMRPFVCDDPNSKTDCFPEWLVRLVLWLGYVNSALNPFIYIGFSPDLRETFRYLICCKCTNVDRRLAQNELRQAIEDERKFHAEDR